MYLKNIFIENQGINIEEIKSSYLGKTGVFKLRDLILCLENTGRIYGLSLNVVCPVNSKPQISYEFFETTLQNKISSKIEKMDDIIYEKRSTIFMLSCKKTPGKTCEMIEKILIANFNRQNIVDLVSKVEL
jgi:hypothetical protein